MKRFFSAPNKARSVITRTVVLTLLAVTVATSLGACVYPYGRGEYRGEGWGGHRGEGWGEHRGEGWHEGGGHREHYQGDHR
jgi:hypothetical protein